MEIGRYLMERYAASPIVRALIQLVPFGAGSATDSLVMDTVVRMREERSRVFFDELVRGEILLDDGVLKDKDFVHAFFATTAYALNSRRNEKIEMFAQLLKSSQLSGGPANFDEYEDFLKILDELSFREVRTLALYDRYSERPKQPDQNDLQWVETFWGEFENLALMELGIAREEIADFMNRIARTGCYEIFTGVYADYTGGKGKLTPTYHKLKAFVERGANAAN